MRHVSEATRQKIEAMRREADKRDGEKIVIAVVVAEILFFVFCGARGIDPVQAMANILAIPVLILILLFVFAFLTLIFGTVFGLGKR
jgi:hypothetical protein